MFLLNLFIKTLYLASPIIFAALLHGIVMKYELMPWLKKPMDMGVTFRGKPLFGPNKTWRGFITCSIGAIVFSYFITLLYLNSEVFKSISIVDFNQVDPLHIGMALGIGMILGELPNSFFKRQTGISSGERGAGFTGILFRIFDQIDLLLGIWFLLLFVPGFSVAKNIDVLLFSIMFALVVHFIIAQIGYFLGMRKDRF
ncbi:MAG: CDP-archaeol synthase [Deltaproteobacteria bacterium]|nr:CDP-archaeol synthase [Deltaproteobacteria bacterium]